VVSVETERVREGPPLPFDLGTLQEVCSKQLGLDVQETLEIAQALYETHKATTYPRSDSGYLPESMFAEVPTVLDSLLKTDPAAPDHGPARPPQRSRAWNDGKVTAHHGIIPTLEPANLSAMSEKELAVYRLIRAHYLAQFLPHHEFDRTVAQLVRQQSLVATASRSRSPAGEVLAAPGPTTGRRGCAAQPGAARCVRACLPGRPGRSQGAQDAAAQALHAGRTGQGHEGRRRS
jgi:DNA topoisomerase-3